MKKSPFAILDGIDGSGKSTVLQIFRQELEAGGQKTLNLTEISRQTAAIPKFEELAPADVIFSDEPTATWVGAAIRNEIIKEGSKYDAMETAQAFSLDRSILYNRVIIPALEAGKTIIQGRGFTTSLVFQPMQGGITPEQILELPGNALAEKYAPELFIQVECSVPNALRRLSQRQKKDDSIFERKPALEKLRAAFYAPWFLEYLKRKQIKRLILDNDAGLDELQKQVKKIIADFFIRP